MLILQAKPAEKKESAPAPPPAVIQPPVQAPSVPVLPPSAGSPPLPSSPQVVPQAPIQAPVAPAINPSVAPESKKPVAVEERFVVGEEYERSITNLMEMGFPREQVVKALKAAFNNPERATDYLLNVIIILGEIQGIPESAAQNVPSAVNPLGGFGAPRPGPGAFPMPGGRMPAPAPQADPIAPEVPEGEGDAPMMPRKIKCSI